MLFRIVEGNNDQTYFTQRFAAAFAVVNVNKLVSSVFWDGAQIPLITKSACYKASSYIRYLYRLAMRLGDDTCTGQWICYRCYYYLLRNWFIVVIIAHCYWDFASGIPVLSPNWFFLYRLEEYNCTAGSKVKEMQSFDTHHSNQQVCNCTGFLIDITCAGK